jgi:hypothetical protein
MRDAAACRHREVWTLESDPGELIRFAIRAATTRRRTWHGRRFQWCRGCGAVRVGRKGERWVKPTPPLYPARKETRRIK